MARGMTNAELVVLSHRRWSAVYRRTEHILSRLAARRRVLFVEEPVYDATGAARWDLSQPCTGVTVARARLPLLLPGFPEEDLEPMRGLLADLLASKNVHDPVFWLTTPRALPLAESFLPRAMVYDRMEEDSDLAGSPADLARREAELLARTDLVFSEGPAPCIDGATGVRGAAPAFQRLPACIDAAHFGRARYRLPEPADLAAVPRPRLGFAGTIDRGLDLHLISALARSHPEWQVVMVGPVTGIDPAALPRGPNIHWRGERPAEDVLRHLASWDVCILPFARSAMAGAASRRALECMAAERTIVASAVPELAGAYASILYLGWSAPDFISACERALSQPPEERERRAAAMRAVIASSSWDAIVRAMEERLEETLAGGEEHGVAEAPAFPPSAVPAGA